MRSPIDVRHADLDAPRLIALLRRHADGMNAESPAGACHYLDLDGLRRPEVTVWAAWADDELAGCGALLELDAGHGEVKSMRTDDAHLGRGVGRALLDRVVATAVDRGYRRLSLETGRTDAFAAAIGLYESAGFAECGPFGDYEDNGFSRFFTRSL